MLLKLGFLNQKRNLKLFNIDDRETAFEVVNLNLNHEPILLTKMALYGIGLILDQVKFKYLQGGPSKRTALKSP